MIIGMTDDPQVTVVPVVQTDVIRAELQRLTVGGDRLLLAVSLGQCTGEINGYFRGIGPAQPS